MLGIYLPRSPYWVHEVNNMVSGSGISEKVPISWFTGSFHVLENYAGKVCMSKNLFEWNLCFKKA